MASAEICGRFSSNDMLRWSAQVQQSGCAAIASLPVLQRLEISQCQSLTDTAACELMRLTALKELCLGNSSRVTDIALSTLVKAMPQLVLLDLSGCHLHVSDVSLYAIAGLSKLQVRPAVPCTSHDALIRSHFHCTLPASSVRGTDRQDSTMPW